MTTFRNLPKNLGPDMNIFLENHALISFLNSAPFEMSYMFNLNTLFWCTTIGFLALYCQIWNAIKSGVQAFNIFLGLFSVFGHSLVIVFLAIFCLTRLHSLQMLLRILY